MYVEAIGLRSFIRFFLDKYGETVAVVYEQTKRTQNMLFADGAQCITFFCAQSGTSIRLTVPENFTSRLLSRPD